MASRNGYFVTYHGVMYGDIVMKLDHIKFQTTDPVRGEVVFGVLVFGDSLKPMIVQIRDTHWGRDNNVFECVKGGEFTSMFEHPVRPELINHHYQYPLEQEVLDAFTEQGVLERTYLDRVLICPECGGIHTVRPGCPNCGSSETVKDTLIHHFACGYVGPKSEFLNDGKIDCPKCSKTNLIVSIDYDVSSGLTRCIKCDWTGNNPSLIGNCLSCDTRFLVAEAGMMDIYEYRLRDEAILK